MTVQRPVPAVRLIVTDHGGRVLLLRRAGSRHGLGGWCLPGGKVDYGDTVETAAAKELREETGLRIEAVKFLFYQDSLPLEPGGMHCINFYFECRATGVLQLNAESSEAEWIGVEDLERYEVVFRNDEGLRRYWSGFDRDPPSATQG